MPQQTFTFTFTITLTDSDNHQQQFKLDIIGDSAHESEATGELTAETTLATIAHGDTGTQILSLNGNAWRDLDSAECLSDFVRKTVIGNMDPQDYLDELALELNVNGPAGRVL